MGSIKSLEIIKEPTENKLGVGIFNFSDKYSVFDWGQMPDDIDKKGTALAMMGAYSFDMIRDSSLYSHYIEMVDEKGKLVSPFGLLYSTLENSSNRMKIQLTRKFPIDNNYAAYQKPGLDNYLLPLEIIFRNGLPKGSSVFRRIKEAKEKGDEQGLENILNNLGLTKEPKEGEFLPRPKCEFTTKFEEQDRHLSYEEALRISGLDIEKFADVLKYAAKANEVITERAKKVGLKHYDGKIELMKYGGIMLVDVVGTFDEDRFSYDGVQVSKEILRQWYAKTPWGQEVMAAKKKASEEGVQDWKSLVKSQPEKLPPELKTLVSQIYQAGANLYTESKIFDVPHLRELVSQVKEYVEV